MGKKRNTVEQSSDSSESDGSEVMDDATSAERAVLDDARLLVLRGQSDRERGAKLIFDHFWKKFKRFAQHMGHSEDTAEEIASDSIHTVLRALDTLHQSKKFTSWAWQIHRHKITDRFREDKDERMTDSGLSDEKWLALMERELQSGAASSSNPVAILCLRGQFEAFATDQPERHFVVERSAVDGWSDSQLAAFLGRTAAATRTYLKDCRQRLREYLQPCLEDAK